MKEALVSKGPTVQVVDSQVPEPNDDQVLIKVVVASSNPKDWKLPEMRNMAANSGDDLAGVVEKVGANVFEFKPGDRVAALHELMAPHGSYAEYLLAPQDTTFHIPHGISFEGSWTSACGGNAAAVALYQHLALPAPWMPLPLGAKAREIPLVIYGASSAVGFYALQLALKSQIHPILAVAGRATDRVRSVLDTDKSDVVVDYRGGDEAVLATLKKALEGHPPIRHAFDAVSEGSSAKIIGQLFREVGDGKTGRFTFGSPGNKDEVPDYVEQAMTFVGTVHKVPEVKDLAYVFCRYIARGMLEGWFRPQRTQVVPGGLNGIQVGLENLKNGKASAVKYVYRVAETEGVDHY